MTSEERRPVRGTLRFVMRHGGRGVAYGLVGGFVMLVAVAVLYLEHRPDLENWHTVHLDAEFTAKAGLTSFDEYRALEDRLFAQLDEQLYAKNPQGDDHDVTRYHRGSLSDPGRWPTNWNRSFELTAADPRAGVLLIHGMSDSPYSMRTLAERLHADGATVLALRVPGHGAAPSGLTTVEWEDMAAAVELAVHHVRASVPDGPHFIVGYSNGGALAVEYALSSLDDDELPPVDGLVLLSPEIGITRLAALAAWQERLGTLLRLEKLRWNSITAEYDPFKYGSFALNAGRQAYELTQEIQKRITRLTESGDLDRFPPVLAFQSGVDATVDATVLVTGLLGRLPRGGHELVVFDIDRRAGIEHMLSNDPGPGLEQMFGRDDLTFALTLVTNKAETSRDIVLRRRTAEDRTVSVTDVELAWPPGVYSLSHVALPFPPEDPVYGGPDAGESPGVQLGNLAFRGERGVIRISGTEQLRLRWNPFHEFLVERTLAFTRDG